MGKENNIMNSYLSDSVRFADFFNAVCFGGVNIISPEGLTEASEKHDISLAENPVTGDRTEKEERIRDIKKIYNSGSVLRVLAMENQSYVDYTAGVRNMRYDAMEYAGQVSKLKAEHKRKNRFKSKDISSGELLSGMLKTDRLHPAYTIWLYHGEEAWNGPRSLKDMMDFGNDDGMSVLFNDYKINLICLNEIKNFDIFHTELRQLFKVIRHRGDKAALQSMMTDGEEFGHLEADTVEAMAVMLHMPEIWDKREKFMSVNEEREEYDMCQGIKEWLEEERNIGFSEGIEKGIESLVRTCRKLNLTRKDALESLREEYEFDTDEAAMQKINLYWGD